LAHQTRAKFLYSAHNSVQGT